MRRLRRCSELLALHGVEFQPVWQLLMLPEGRYKLKGEYKGEIAGRRGLVWRLACADGERQLSLRLRLAVRRPED